MSDYGDYDDGDDGYDGYDDNSEYDYGEDSDNGNDYYDERDDGEESEEEGFQEKYLGRKIKRNNGNEKSNENEDDEEEENGDEEDEENEDDKEQDNYEFNCETGDIGEKIVYDDLKNNDNKIKIKWMNKNGESFKPYDFSFKKGDKTIYIDAKSTVFEKGDDPLPIISENEQEFINNLKSNEKYIIARVFDARGKNPKISYFDAKTMKKINLSQI